MNKYLLLLLFSFLFLVSCMEEKIPEIIELNKNWEFRKTNTDNWYPAKVPGTVHTDLLVNKLIEDPFYRLNEKDVQWIDKEDWEYKTYFYLDKTKYKLKNGNIYELVFNGIDTYSEIYLNNNLIFTTDNMFIDWNKKVNEYLKEERNELRIRLKSPIKEDLFKVARKGYQLPAINDQSYRGQVGANKVSVYARKAPYHYGWDWGPRLVTSGIWRPVYLKVWSDSKIRDFFVIPNNTIYTDKAKLKFEYEIEIDKKGEYEITLEVDGDEVYYKELVLEKGNHNLKNYFILEKPELWWPRGYGEQKLYEIELKIIKDNVLLDKLNRKVGLRLTELVQETDSIGTNFYFKINGIPIFMRGANYIPQDVFLTRVTKKDYDNIIKSAYEANMNMIRIWGGGIYEDNYFYEKCDELGMMIWQDFMFACSMYPGDKKFLDNVKKEVEYNVKRLRNHSSIVLWCGNNEVLDAWNKWGWQERYNKKQKKEIWQAYEDIFYDIFLVEL